MSEQMSSWTAEERDEHRETLRRILAAVGDGAGAVVFKNQPNEFAIRAGCNALGRVGELDAENERLHHKIAHLHNVAEEADAAARAAENECRLAAKYIAMSPCDPDCTPAQFFAWLDYQAVRLGHIKKDASE